MTDLKPVSLGDNDRVEVTRLETGMDVNVNVPFSPECPTRTEVERDGGQDVVSGETEPSKHRGTTKSS